MYHIDRLFHNKTKPSVYVHGILAGKYKEGYCHIIFLKDI